MKLQRHFPFVILILLLVACYSEAPTGSAISEKTLTNPPAITVTSKEADGYIGLIYPPIPNSIITSTSWEASISPSSSQNWSIAIVTDRKQFMLWFSQLLYHDQDGKAYSQIKDVAILPLPISNNVILVSSCLLKGFPDPEIVVLAKIDEESLMKRYILNPNVLLAWRANRLTGELEQIDTKDIECYAETFLDYPSETS